jgi:hypothetical protein
MLARVKQSYFFIYPEAYHLATKEPGMSPEPVNEKPVAKPEIRGGDKFEDVLEDIHVPGHCLYLDDDEDVIADVQYNDLGLYLDVDEDVIADAQYNDDDDL